MASDRCMSDSTEDRYTMPQAKTRKIGNTLIGGCGNITPMVMILNMPELKALDKVNNVHEHIWSVLIPKINSKLDLHGLRSEVDKESSHLCTMLIATQNQVYTLDISSSSIDIYESNTPVTMGSGSPYAMAAYKTLETLEIVQGGLNMSKIDKITLATSMAGVCNTFCDTNIDVIKGGGISLS